MARYLFTLNVKGSQNASKYSLDLDSKQENNPEHFFASEIREVIRKDLQKQSSCKIADHHLNQLLKTWTQDIKEGYRDSMMTLDLPLLIASNTANLQETGNQESPSLIEPNISDIEPLWGMPPPLIFS